MSDQCRVDGCDRRAAASMIRDSLPGPLRLCATHTEDFRMNGAGWTVVWEQSAPEPTSVQPAAAAAVGRVGATSEKETESYPPAAKGAKYRLSAWRKSRS